jgi:hypothetical protein
MSICAPDPNIKIYGPPGDNRHNKFTWSTDFKSEKRMRKIDKIFNVREEDK